MTRAKVELVLAVLALIGAVAAWLSARSQVAVAPIIEGEPSTTSVVYYAPNLTLSLLLGTIAGVLVVLAVTRLRRHPAPPPAPAPE